MILKDSFDIDHVSSFVSSIAKFENRAFTLPFDFPAVLIIFADWGGETLPTLRAGRGREPPLPAGRDGYPWSIC